MRPRVSGMNEVDDAVLELFDRQDNGLWLSPAVVHWHVTEVYEATDKSKETVARRMRKLVKRDLLSRVDQKGYYKITDKGRAYLQGDLEAQDLQLLDDS